MTESVLPLAPLRAVMVLAREQRNAAQAAAIQDVELRRDGRLARRLAVEHHVVAAHSAHGALAVALVREVEGSKDSNLSVEFLGKGVRYRRRISSNECFPRSCQKCFALCCHFGHTLFHLA